MKKYIILLVVLLSFSNANASHLLGGEITWQCLTSGPNQGEYIFTMKLYRDCDGITFLQAQTLEMWGAGAPFTTITLDFNSLIQIFLQMEMRQIVELLVWIVLLGMLEQLKNIFIRLHLLHY